jgi:hypothetical protein
MGFRFVAAALKSGARFERLLPEPDRASQVTVIDPGSRPRIENSKTSVERLLSDLTRPNLQGFSHLWNWHHRWDTPSFDNRADVLPGAPTKKGRRRWACTLSIACQAACWKIAGLQT